MKSWGKNTHIRLIDFKTKYKTKKTWYNDKVSIQEEDITRINIYAPNIGAPKYIKQILQTYREKLKITQ